MMVHGTDTDTQSLHIHYINHFHHSVCAVSCTSQQPCVHVDTYIVFTYVAEQICIAIQLQRHRKQNTSIVWFMFGWCLMSVILLTRYAWLPPCSDDTCHHNGTHNNNNQKQDHQDDYPKEMQYSRSFTSKYKRNNSDKNHNTTLLTRFHFN